MKELLKQYQAELQNTIKAMQVVKEQIAVYNKKGYELATHATFLNGKIEVLKELLENKEENNNE